MTDADALTAAVDRIVEQTANKFPSTLAMALADAQREVKELAQGDRNQYSKYNYTSIDDFLNAMRPILSSSGITILMDEESATQAGDNIWIRFGFTLVHSSGERWGPMRRTVAVQALGPAQAFGSAQSYALKQFLRATFLVATGDGDDPDAHKPEPIEQVDVKSGMVVETPAPRKTRGQPVTAEQLRHKFANKGIDDDTRKAYLRLNDGVASLTELPEPRLNELWKALNHKDAKKRIEAKVVELREMADKFDDTKKQADELFDGGSK